MNFALTLEYSLAEGWLAPFVAGLRSGQAVAARCGDCSRISFPPARVCDCGCRSSDWLTLPGTATVAYRTTGADGDFALVRFDVSDTHSVARLDRFGPDDIKGCIVACLAERPALILCPLAEGEKR